MSVICHTVELLDNTGWTISLALCTEMVLSVLEVLIISQAVLRVDGKSLSKRLEAH